jgi:hypothetical protein
MQNARAVPALALRITSAPRTVKALRASFAALRPCGVTVRSAAVLLQPCRKGETDIRVAPSLNREPAGELVGERRLDLFATKITTHHEGDVLTLCFGRGIEGSNGGKNLPVCDGER